MRVSLLRPPFIRAFLNFLAGFLFVAISIVSVADEKRPNILFIFSDDHALQAIGAYGSTINETPNIDRLAEEGAVFENSFVGNSLCGPSRAIILTGKHSHKNGFLRNGDKFDGSQTTFPKLLQEVGYQTALIGKWHLNSDPVGFDFWKILPGQGSYYNPNFIHMDGSVKRETGYVTDIITDDAIDWLENQRDREKPFMLMAQHKAPHRNWSPAERHLELYDDVDIPEPETLYDDYSGRVEYLKENEMMIRDHFYWGHDMKFHGENEFPEHFLSMPNGEYRRMNEEQRAAWDNAYEPKNQAFLDQLRAGELSDDDILRWKYQRYVKDYLRTVAAVDEGIGKILDYLEESGEADNTIVIYSSDQGFFLGEHGWYDKRWMFEESFKMPFLIRWPGVIEPGSRPEAMIQNIDYGPTFLDIAGAEIPEEMQGRSLVPVFENTAEIPSDWRDAVYYSYYENDAYHHVPIHDGVRNDRYKLMFFQRRSVWQLFDLQEDPNEMRSVHDDPEYAEVFAAMQKRYRDLRGFYDVNPAIIMQSRGDEPRWKNRQVAVNELAKKGGFDLAFIGDSITEGWERAGKEVWEEFYADRNPINLGFGGDRTEHVLFRLQRGNLSNVRPKVAVVMIGTNNTGHRMQDPVEVAAGVKRILEVLEERTPETKILLLGIFPRSAEPLDDFRLNNVAINQIIRRYADGERIHYLDLGHVFLEPDGTLSTEVMPDLLHLSPEAYRLWAEAMEPKLQELLGF
ncbi:MAG TPA: sulfatase/phosphatase domain-containing protein [Opitutales bacterium]|nr:sulfatase/phosphatase domain-containing protein [Opitutales bacterium]